MRAAVILVALLVAAAAISACGSTEVRAETAPTEVGMVVHVPCVTPPCDRVGAEQAPPAAITGRPAPTMLALGWDHSCALTADGGVWCWGDNGHDQLGDIGADAAPVPTRVPSLPAMAAVWAGANQSCGRARDDGQLWCWGETGLGPSREPVFAEALPFTDVRLVSLAYRKGCFITADGALYCWGDYGAPHGPRWDGPRRVPLEGVVALRGGMNRFCALTSRGGLSCWGMHPAYTLVERGTDPLWTLPDVRDVALFTFDDFAPHPPLFVVDRDARVHEVTPTGRPDTRSGQRHLALRAVEGLDGVVEIASSGNHQCARTSGGTAACWGSNPQGQVGDGSTATRQEPRTLELTGVEEIAVGKSHTCARRGVDLFCWGDNRRGQAGAAGVHEVLEPTQVPW